MKFTSHIFRSFFLLLFLAVNSVYAQNEKGVLNIRNYSPQEYGAHAQNLCITQDKRGIMYFGNNRGVLEFDGNFWRLISVSNETSVTALDVDSTGRLYVGADAELGYLIPDAKGQLVYRSLNDKLPKDIKDLDRVIRIFCLREGVFYVTRKYLLLWDGKEFKKWIPETHFHTSFLVNDQLFVKVKDRGVYFMKNDKLELLPGTEELAPFSIYDISLFSGKMVMTTADQGVFVYEGNKLNRLPIEIGNVYNAVNVSDAYYVIGLFGDGLIVLNNKFEIEFEIGLNNGLEDGTVHNLFVDNESNLWLALGRGIAKIELVSPVTLHNYDTGLKGTVQDVIRHKGVLYVSSSNGVFYMSDNKAGEKKFKQIPNFTIDCYGMTTFVLEGDSILLVSGVDGIYEINTTDRKPERIMESYPWMSGQSQTYKNRLIVVEDGGLSSVVRKDGRWVSEGLVEGLEANIFNFVEEKNGDLWLGTMGDGLFKTTTRIFADSKTKISKYDSTSGLPEGPIFITHMNDGSIALGTDLGIYRFDEKKERFYPDEKYKITGKIGKTGVHRLGMDSKNQIWISSFFEDNTYDIMYFKDTAWYKTPFLRYNSEIVQCIYHEANGITWLGSAQGLIRYDQKVVKDFDFPFIVSIRRVIAANKSIFDGAFYDKDSMLISGQPEGEEVVLSFGQNNITFEFSALTYYDEKGTLFSYMLEGQTEEWSEWSGSPRAIFTNIHEGSYTFRVKARNIYGKESPEAVFNFEVLPPWWRTIWAYISYFILFVAFVWGAVLVSTRSLKRIIEERTAEIVNQKEEIEKQKEIVEEKNKDILDSIKYAKRIQDAILPGEDVMKEVMGRDLFVLFRPKDIVSGDFYWMRVKGPKLLFAAVDCTGHGVPGAFVSIVGNNGLNRAVNEFGQVQPAGILDNLAITVEDSFRHHGNSEVRDGMDISLCSLEMTGFNSAILEYAGANNPLWIIKKNNPTEVLETKADKQPIGKYENRKPYTNHTYELEKGDTIYIFSDGYADQFGGPAGKKFKYAQLKELLVSIQHLNMTEQRDLLFNKFEEWKNTLEQIDDVCVIGVRI